MLQRVYTPLLPSVLPFIRSDQISLNTIPRWRPWQSAIILTTLCYKLES